MNVGTKRWRRMKMSNADQFLFLGNDPALDLLNTTPVLSSGPVDLLGSYADLADWLAASGLATAREARELRQKYSTARSGEVALSQVKQLREALRRIVLAIEKHETLPERSMAEVNDVLRRGRGFYRIVLGPEPESFRRQWSFERDDVMSRSIAPLAHAVLRLLTERHLRLIRKCENPACVLHYYDTSKNHSRRWCSMEVCGNRMKAALHYRRHRAK